MTKWTDAVGSIAAWVSAIAATATAIMVFTLQTTLQQQQLDNARRTQTTDLLIKYNSQLLDKQTELYYSAACMKFIIANSDKENFEQIIKPKDLTSQYSFSEDVVTLQPESGDWKTCVTPGIEKSLPFSIFNNRFFLRFNMYEALLAGWAIDRQDNDHRTSNQHSKLVVSEVHRDICEGKTKVIFQIMPTKSPYLDSELTKAFPILRAFIASECAARGVN